MVKIIQSNIGKGCSTTIDLLDLAENIWWT